MFSRGTVSNGMNSALFSNDDTDLLFSIISVTDEVVTADLCSFNWLTLTKRNGAAINHVFSKSYSLYLNGNNFTECVCNEGYDSAIFADRLNGNIRIYNKSVDDPCKFEDCQSICEDSSRDGAIFIISNSITLYNLLFVHSEDDITSSDVADYENDYYIVSTDMEMIFILLVLI